MSIDVYPKVKPKNAKDASGMSAPEAETIEKGGCVCVPDMRLTLGTVLCCAGSAAGDSVGELDIADTGVGEFVGR